MIQSNKPSLSLCAISAGAAHAAVLALVLPVMITLPAPNQKAQGIAAVQVAVATAAPHPIAAAMQPDSLDGEGDIDDAAWHTPAPEEVTGALPEVAAETALAREAVLSEQAAPAPSVVPVDPVEPKGTLVDSVPAAEPTDESALDMVASLAPQDFVEAGEAEEADLTLATVPMPLRKPHLKAAAIGAVVAAEVVEKPSPKRQIHVRSPRLGAAASHQQPAVRGILGGRRATTMQEYRVPGE